MLHVESLGLNNEHIVDNEKKKTAMLSDCKFKNRAPG